MKALTIKQPWAWAILAGHKRVENRTWRTDYRGPLAIHAARDVDAKGAEWIRSSGRLPIPDLEDLPTQAIIGTVDLVDVVSLEKVRDRGYWTSGPWCWILANPRPLAEPFPVRGWQRLWEIPDELLSV